MSNAGIYLKEGTIVDATIIEAASSTNNKEKARDPEMLQAQKGKQWLFGLKAQISVDARTGLIHSLSTTAANVHDMIETEHLLHGEERFISADSGYRGAQKREELKADWLIAATYKRKGQAKCAFSRNIQESISNLSERNTLKPAFEQK